MLRMIQEEQIEVSYVVNVNIRAGLGSAQHSNLALRQGLHGQEIDGNVQAHARRVAANRRRPDNLHHHLIGIAQNNPLTDHFRLVVFGERLEGHILDDSLFFLEAIDAARGRVDNAADSLAGRAVRPLHRREATDFPGQFRVEVATGIVRHGRQVDDRLNSIQIDPFDIPDIALDDPQVRMRGQRVAEPHDIQNSNVVPRFQQFRDKNAPLVATAARHQQSHGISL